MSIILAYFYWYYIERTQDMVVVFKDYFRYWIFFFSIKQTLRSLFAPWKMIDAAGTNSYDIKVILESFFSNIFSRFMGFFMRSILIAFFIAIELLTVLLGVVFLIAWIFAPLILVSIIIYSFTKINV